MVGKEACPSALAPYKTSDGEERGGTGVEQIMNKFTNFLFLAQHHL